MDGSLVILVALLVIVAGVTYLVVERPRLPPRPKPPAQSEERQWHVQCPNCSRWKEMAPVDSDQGEFTQEDGNIALQPDGKYRFHNKYRCPFCGHRWEETYLE